MVIRVTKDLIDKAILVDDDTFAVADSEDLAIPADPESWELKRVSWWALKDLFINNTVTFVVTSPFASWEIIDIADGTGNITGATTRTIWDTWDVTSLWISAAVFNSNASFRVTDNKTVALKGNDVVWDSETTFHFTRALAIWEWFIIEDWTTSGGWTIGNTTVEWDLTVTWTSDLQWDVTIGWTITKAWSTVWSVVTFVDDTAWSSIVNLPTAVGLLNQSFSYIRTDITTNTTTFNPDGSETINNVASSTIWQWESITIISDDYNWFII